METAVVLIVLLALPFLVRAICRAVIAECVRIREQRRPPVASDAPIERVAADLRRLRAQLEARENRPGVTGKGMRMGALRTAYVETLGQACRQLGVTPPAGGTEWQTPLAEIYRVESELRRHGLDVRTTGYRQDRAA